MTPELTEALIELVHIISYRFLPGVLIVWMIINIWRGFRD